MANNWAKKQHSITLSALLCLTHVLPLACKSKQITETIFLDTTRFDLSSWNFHGKWTLDGWNDGIIRPARDAVFNYYMVCASIPFPTVFALNSFNPNPTGISAMQNHSRSKNTCVSTIYPSLSSCSDRSVAFPSVAIRIISHPVISGFINPQIIKLCGARALRFEWIFPCTTLRWPGHPTLQRLRKRC